MRIHMATSCPWMLACFAHRLVPRRWWWPQRAASIPAKYLRCRCISGIYGGMPCAETAVDDRAGTYAIRSTSTGWGLAAGWSVKRTKKMEEVPVG